MTSKFDKQFLRQGWPRWEIRVKLAPLNRRSSSSGDRGVLVTRDLYSSVACSKFGDTHAAKDGPGWTREVDGTVSQRYAIKAY